MALVAFRKAETAEAQVLILGNLSARWDLLADAAKGPAVWKAIARKMGPQALRMNLNTLVRHGVIGPDANREMVDYVAARLADAGRDPPFAAVPVPVPGGVPERRRRGSAEDQGGLAQGGRDRLRQRAGVAGSGRDRPGRVGLDGSAVTGHRGRGATSKMRCVDVAALFAAAILRRNPDSVVIPFDTAAYEAKVDPSDSILSLAERLAKYGGGGTNCSLPLAAANAQYANRRFAGCVLVSDNESWVGTGRARLDGRDDRVADVRRATRSGCTATALQARSWSASTCSRTRPPRPRSASDILNVGGFSDAVFSVVAAFLADDAGRFVAEVEAVEL